MIVEERKYFSYSTKKTLLECNND